MGWVWNIMLSFDNEELWEDGEEEARETCELLEEINAHINHGRLVNLVGPTYEDNVGNGMDANLYGGGFKNFDIEEFIELVKSQKWKKRSKVQLWIKGAEEGMGDQPFKLIGLGKLTSRNPSSARSVPTPKKPAKRKRKNA